MDDKTITERQYYWLEHLKAANAVNRSLVDYAKTNDLKVTDRNPLKTTRL